MSQSIESKIIIVREQRVIADSELALLYGVSTKRLNEQVTPTEDEGSYREFSPNTAPLWPLTY